MAEFDLMDGLRKMFMAGVGAVATGVEQGQEVVEDKVLRARLEAMSADERAAFAAKVAEMSADIDAAAVKVEVEEAAEGTDAAEDTAE